jgi:hypothetical protein
LEYEEVACRHAGVTQVTDKKAFFCGMTDFDPKNPPGTLFADGVQPPPGGEKLALTCRYV